MKILVREFDKNSQATSDKIPLYDDVMNTFHLSPSDGVIITATSVDEFGNESIYTIILEREEFEQLKKL